MKKSICLITVMCFVLINCTSCGGQAGDAGRTDQLIGSWDVDSVALIENSDSIMQGPMEPTFWKFNTNGEIECGGFFAQSGTYTLAGDELTFNIKKPFPANHKYFVLLLNENQLHVKSGIIKMDDVSMQSYSYLTKRAQ